MQSEGTAPRTKFTRSGRYSIAYQVIGEGPFDLLYIPGFVSNVELGWHEPRLARFLGGLASFSRLILFDKRGTGLSDRVSLDELPTLEERLEDVVAVLDAVGSERAAIVSHSEGGNLGVLFAALMAQPLADEGFTLSYPVVTLVFLLILSALAGVLAAIPPARRASRLDPLEALHYE